MFNLFADAALSQYFGKSATYLPNTGSDVITIIFIASMLIVLGLMGRMASKAPGTVITPYE